MAIPEKQHVYRIKQLPARTGLGVSLIYREMKDGNFPKGRKVNQHIRVWSEEEIEAEMQRRFALYN